MTIISPLPFNLQDGTTALAAQVMANFNQIVANVNANAVGSGAPLPVTSGGTGIAAGTSGGLLYFASSTSIASSSVLTANAIVKGGGAGTTPSASGVIISSTNLISGYGGLVNAQTGTTYTLQASDMGKILTFSNASAITVTLPNSLQVGFVCTCYQKGAGQVTFVADSGATLNNRSSQSKSAGQYAAMSLYVDANSGGSSAIYFLAGDTGA